MRYLLLLIALLLLPACSEPAAPSLPPAAERQAAWDSWRAARDSLFLSAESPLLPAQRDTFGTLAYFRYDSTLAFPLALDPALQADTIRLATSTGEPRDYIPFGTFSFPVGERRPRLTVFKSVGPLAVEDHLFVPFTDATSGQDTYGGGRYLDLRPTPSGRYVLDFNYAYHPYCVYNPAYSCPLPPRENRLAVPIRAGERLSGPPAVPPPTM